MGKVAFLFAGQGAQHPGMCADLIESEPAAKAVFDAADAVRPGTTEQCLSGTKEELSQTINTQPCVFAADLACARALAARGVTPDVVAGFSLGEVAALTFAGAYTDEQGFELVCHRAELMADAAEKNPGAMRAVVKLDAATVERLAAEAGEAWPVNYNSPLQTVVAGTAEACEKLDLLVKEAKGRAMKVAVSGAFHSPFMAEAERGLAAYLADGHAPAEPSVPVVLCTDYGWDQLELAFTFSAVNSSPNFTATNVHCYLVDLSDGTRYPLDASKSSIAPGESIYFTGGHDTLDNTVALAYVEYQMAGLHMQTPPVVINVGKD